MKYFKGLTKARRFVLCRLIDKNPGEGWPLTYVRPVIDSIILYPEKEVVDCILWLAAKRFIILYEHKSDPNAPAVYSLTKQSIEFKKEG